MNIDRFKEIFKGLERAHGCTKVSEPVADGVKLKGQSFVVRQPVTDDLWLKHLKGSQSLGIIPINDDNQCIWGCVDIDSYAGFDHKKLIEQIKQLKLPLIVCRSKSGGAHVFLFTIEPVSAERMRDKLTEIKTALGYGGSEVFPKQIKLKSHDDTGNFLTYHTLMVINQHDMLLKVMEKQQLFQNFTNCMIMLSKKILKK